MADIAASDVTYTQNSAAQIVVQGRRNNVMTISFGNGSLTYPSGGIPLTKASLGCPTVVERFLFQNMANGDGYIYKYDPTNFKIRIYQGDSDGVADGPMVELGSVAVAATSLSVNVSGW